MHPGGLLYHLLPYRTYFLDEREIAAGSGSRHATTGIDTAIEKNGAVLAFVKGFDADGRGPRSFTPEEIAEDENALADNALADPEQASESFLSRLANAAGDLVRESRRSGS